MTNSTANISKSRDVSSPYPFDSMIIMTTTRGSSGTTDGSSISISAPIPGISRQAMLFVAWGVITLFYCIVAVGVYVTTMAKADDLGKVYICLVYTVSVQWDLG